jgi:hypothetical protein
VALSVSTAVAVRVKFTMKIMEDWSDSSSESSSLPGFTVTVNYPPAGEDQDGLQFETFNLDAYNSESAGMESLLSQQFLVQEVSPFHVKRDGDLRPPLITSMNKDVAGSVCLCGFEGLEDINAIQRLAADGGAKALFVLRRPSTELSDQMPVFVVHSEVILKLVAHIHATVTFQWNDGARSSSPSTAEEMNEVPTSVEQGWVGLETTAHGMSLAVDTNAPIEPLGKAPTVAVGDRNTLIDLLQMDSSGDDIGPIALDHGCGEKKAPHEVIFRCVSPLHPNTPIDLLQMDSSGDNDPDIGQFSTGSGEKKAPREVNFR